MEQTLIFLPSLSDDIAVFRRFNRMYTRFIGTLQEGLLDTAFTLTEARVLYELATRAKPRAREVVEELGIDPGYLSRMLRRFERDGLLQRNPTPEDARYAEIALTQRGQAAFEELNSRSEQQAQIILAALDQNERTQLIRAMQTIEAILVRKNDGRRYVLRQHRIGDMGWVVHREGTYYAEEYGWDATFEALVARIVADFVDHFDRERERCWIAEADGQSLGHVFLVRHPEEPQTAKLRLLFVEPDARGMGLGRALVNECIRFAREAGYRRIVLWTQSILVAAHRIYEAAGFRLIAEEPHYSFGKELVGQTWALDLY